LGYKSINYDLVYGLPKQDAASFEYTLEEVFRLKPERIALYSYAHIPWQKPAQKSYEQFLPSPELKSHLYGTAKEKLVQAGYNDIGMDHFALPEDSLSLAMEAGTLHRNFMGYTDQRTSAMIGLGVSSIGDSYYGFAQNIKDIKTYLSTIKDGKLPLTKGHIHSNDDLETRDRILDLMCRFKTILSNEELNPVIEKLEGFIADGLVKINQRSLIVTEAGKPFVRNICMTFDRYLKSDKTAINRFSKTV
jgi:oxygen-independent coproporphyrinogen-3 oxidase